MKKVLSSFLERRGEWGKDRKDWTRNYGAKLGPREVVVSIPVADG